jgi:hypothetical protein
MAECQLHKLVNLLSPNYFILSINYLILGLNDYLHVKHGIQRILQ